MLISYDRPPGNWSVTGGSFASGFDGSALTNGRPADATRMVWPSGAQTTSVTQVLTYTFTGGAIDARCAGLIIPAASTTNLMPAGVKVTFAGKLSGGNVALNGNAITQRTVTLPNGSVVIWVVFPAVSIDTLVVTIYNDKNGSTWISASANHDLGEIWVGKGADFNVANDIVKELMGGLLQRRSHNNQAWALEVQPYWQLTANLVAMEEYIAIGPNSAQDDYETVLEAISTAEAAVLIPSYLSRGPVNGNSATNGAPPPVIDSTTISNQRLNRMAVLGIVEQPIRLTANGDRFYTSPIVFGESPP